MATLHAGSKSVNIIKSINDFVRSRLETTRSYVLDWGQPGFKEEGKEKWIQFRFLSSTGRFMRLVDNSARVGEIRDGFLVFNLFEKHPPRTNLYQLETVHDNIMSDIYLQDILIYDHDTAGNPRVGNVRVLEVTNDGLIDGGEVSGLKQHNLTFRVHNLFAVAL